MKKRIINILSICLLLCLMTFTFCSNGFSGTGRSNIIGMSMGRVSAASSRGLEAIGTNPANLAFGDHNSTVTFTILPNIGLNFSSDFLEYEIYNDYFTGEDSAGTRIGKKLTNSDKERILTIFPSGLGESHFDSDIRLFGITLYLNAIGGIGITISERISADIEIPRDYARFLLYGLDSSGSQYDFSGTSAKGWWLREYSLSYASKIPDIGFIKNNTAGITLKLVHGFAYFSTDRYSAHFSNIKYTDNFGFGYQLHGDFDFLARQSTINGIGNGDNSFKFFPKPAGTGFGADIGFSAEVYPGIRTALSMTDIGSITWSLNNKEISSRSSFDMTNLVSKEQQDSLEHVFKGKEQESGQFSTSLPLALRFGALIQVKSLGWMRWLPGNMTLGIEYHQGFNKAPGNSRRPRFALGTEYRIVEFFPIRTGISIGGPDRFNWAAGFGIDFNAFNLNLGTENIALLFTPKSFDQFSIGLGMVVRI